MSESAVRIDLRSLTGLRFVAAAMVFGCHAGELMGYSQDGPGRLLAPGMVGVSFFFILSGFLLSYTHRPKGNARDFWQRRFARIYPAYFVAWILIAGTDVVTGDGFTWTDALSLTLTQAWFPSEAIYFAVSAVFWSLSCEAFFYLVFPSIYSILARLSGAGRGFAMAAIVAMVFAIAWAVDPLTSGSVGHWFLYFFPPTRLLEFALGILLALQLRRGRVPDVSLFWATALVLLSFVNSAFVPGSFMRVSITLVPFALLILVAARADLAGRRSPFRGTVLVTLGEWSYCFYLLHATALGFYLSTVERVFGFHRLEIGWMMQAVHLAAAFCVGTAAAAVLYWLIERPMNVRLRPTRRVPEPVRKPVDQ